MPEPRRSRSLMAHFSEVADPREGWRVLYPLREVLLLVLSATLAEWMISLRSSCEAGSGSTSCGGFIPMSAVFPRTTR